MKDPDVSLERASETRRAAAGFKAAVALAALGVALLAEPAPVAGGAAGFPGAVFPAGFDGVFAAAPVLLFTVVRAVLATTFLVPGIGLSLPARGGVADVAIWSAPVPDSDLRADPAFAGVAAGTFFPASLMAGRVTVAFIASSQE